MNRIIIMGNVGSDPITRKPNESKISNFPVAVNDNTKSKSNENGKSVEWFKCVAFNSIADYVESYVKKGSRVLIEGKIKSREYIDKNGIKRLTTECIVDRLELIRMENQSKQIDEFINDYHG